MFDMFRFTSVPKIDHKCCIIQNRKEMLWALTVQMTHIHTMSRKLIDWALIWHMTEISGPTQVSRMKFFILPIYSLRLTENSKFQRKIPISNEIILEIIRLNSPSKCWSQFRRGQTLDGWILSTFRPLRMERKQTIFRLQWKIFLNSFKHSEHNCIIFC